jgi:GT2 family glycosyltransferase
MKDVRLREFFDGVTCRFMKKIAFVVLAWNKLETTTRLFLDSLYQYTDSKVFDLIFVDNGSTDGTADYVREYAAAKDNLFLIENPENLGYSKGNNQGLKYIADKDYEYVGLLNNDILFTPDWLENIFICFDHDPQLGMVSPKGQNGKKFTVDNYLGKYEKFLKKYKNLMYYTTEPLFCCVVIKKEVIDRIGLMDENFTPAFWEDNDYCFRAMYAGYSLARSNRSFVFHNHMSTSSEIAKEISRRNAEYFFQKHPMAKRYWSVRRTSFFKMIIRYIKDGFER